MNTRQSSQLLDRIQRALTRDRDLPVAHLAGKALRFGAATALAPLHLFGCDRVGPGARTYGRPLIDNAGRLEIGAHINLCSTFSPVRLSTGPRGRLEIGDDVVINFGSTIAAEAEIVLGDRVSLGPYVTLADRDGEPAAEPIRVGHDVWLATRVRVRPGAVIGDGAVIMAGSEVVGEIPAGAVAGGVPALVLRRIGVPAHEATAGARQGGDAVRRTLRRLADGASRGLTRLALRGADVVGARPRLDGRPFIENLGRLVIGDDLWLSSIPVRSHIVVGPRGSLRIGDGVHIGAGAAIAAEDRVEIGDGARLGAQVMLLGSDFHAADDRGAPGAAAPIVIGAGASIGDRVIVMHGATIGAGARVEAGSVVSGIVPDGAVALGVPALVRDEPRTAEPEMAPEPPASGVIDVGSAVARALRGIVPEADLAALSPLAAFRAELDFDSMDFLRFVTALHRELGVTIPEADYPALTTLAACHSYLSGRVAALPATDRPRPGPEMAAS